LVALVVLWICEFTVVLWLRGLSIAEYFASRDLVAGAVYLVMLGLFAAMPLLLTRAGGSDR
jgi:type IV secretory pathway TrbD component